jgi:hypothetical protein
MRRVMAGCCRLYHHLLLCGRAPVYSVAYSPRSERRFHAIMNARRASAAAAADLGSSVYDEIDNVLGFAANATYLCPGLAEGRAGAVSTRIAPGGLPRSAADSARQAAYGQLRKLSLPF